MAPLQTGILAACRVVGKAAIVSKHMERCCNRHSSFCSSKRATTTTARRLTCLLRRAIGLAPGGLAGRRAGRPRRRARRPPRPSRQRACRAAVAPGWRRRAKPTKQPPDCAERSRLDRRVNHRDTSLRNMRSALPRSGFQRRIPSVLAPPPRQASSAGLARRLPPQHAELHRPAPRKISIMSAEVTRHVRERASAACAGE